MGKKKNKSNKIPDGRTLQTRDEYFEGQGGYRKPGHKRQDFYRRVVVVDSNRDDELAVVHLTGDKGIPLKDYAQGRSGYKPLVKILDDKKKPIKIGYKFRENEPSRNVSKQDVIVIKKECFTNPKVKKENRRKVRRLKQRDKK
jgi:hypothetical protein